MSYIRCLSNPEGLYVWADCDGTTYFWIGGEENDDKSCIRIPNHHFVKVCEKWYEGEDPLSYKGVKVYEDNKDWKIVLSYKGKSIRMWRVTWEYIVRHGTWGTKWDDMYHFRKKLRKLREKYKRRG